MGDASVTSVHGMIDALVAEGIPSERIVVGGFSQGGALALLSVLSYPKTLAAACCLSGWVQLEDRFPQYMSEANRQTRIFWGHGQLDQVVEFALQAQGVGFLAKHRGGGEAISHHAYRMQHSACDQEFNDLQQFLDDVLSG